MPIISLDAEFINNIVHALRNLFEILTMLLNSLVNHHPDKLTDTMEGIWGALYWLIQDLNLVLDSVFTSTVEVTFKDIPSLNVSNFVGDPEATRGATYVLNTTLNTLVNNEGGMVTSMLYHLFDFLSYLLRFVGELMQSLPDALPLA